MSYTFFEDDIKKGKVGEVIFKEDFLEHLNINYKDVTTHQAFQVIDTDYLASMGDKIEVKTNYKDDKHLIMEDYTHFDPEGHEIRLGWLHQSEADLFAFVSKNTRTIVFLPNTDKFKKHYLNDVKKHVGLILNKPSRKGANIWQSAFRKVPFEFLRGYISIYKRL